MDRLLFKSILAAALIVISSFFCWNAEAQTHPLSGIVLDGNGISIPGVQVLVEGTSNGTTTDGEGGFSLKNVTVGQKVTFSFMGYVTKTVDVTSAETMQVVLKEDLMSLDALVVVGYGVQKKSNITGAIASVKSDDLASRGVEDIQHALQGKAAGVLVMSNSAEPNSTTSIRIRGVSSNSSGSSEPLYIVDGLKVSDISYLDPQIVESMEILKDGASAAIYGAEAGNGVILITTKSGKKGEGRIFYDVSYGFNSLGYKPNVMNAEEYIAYQRAAGNGTLMDKWDGTDTDWYEALYGDGGSIMRHTVGFEIGSDKGSFYAAATYLDNDGMFYGDQDYLKRTTFQVNGSYNIKKWLKFESNNSIESGKYANTGDGTQYRNTNSIFSASKIDPLTPMFYSKDNVPAYMQALFASEGENMFMKNANGDYVAVPQYNSDLANPLTNYYDYNGQNKAIAIRGTTALNLTPFKGLTVTSRLGYRLAATNYYGYHVPCYFSVSTRTKQDYTHTNSMTRYYQWENFANYLGTFGKHEVSAMVGMSYQNSWYDYTSGSTDTFSNAAANFRYLNYSTADAIDTVAGEESISRSISYFGRVGYTYDNRYSIQATFRADAYDTSKLSPEARWGYFPSVSLGWNISNERFMDSVSKSTLSLLKVRASYGVNGNVNILSGYPYASSLNVSDRYPIGGSIISTISPSDILANPSLEWETSKQFDFGVDVRMLSDRLSFAVDFFDKNTTGQLVSMTSPLSSGTSTVTRNVGKVNNRGLEYEIGWQDSIGDFSYGVSTNGAFLHNEVVDMGGNSRIAGLGISVFDQGHPVWTHYGYNYLGVAKDGTAIYEDLNDDGVINDKDKTYLGSGIPKFTYGLTLNAAWKGFDMVIFGSGVAGNKLFLNVGSAYNNRNADFWNKSWDLLGDKALYPHPDPNGDTHYNKSSMLLSNGSYFRIKQIQLGYTLPEKLVKTAAMTKARVYVSLDNFFTFTNYLGADPETATADGSGIDFDNYPTPRTFTVGCNITF